MRRLLVAFALVALAGCSTLPQRSLDRAEVIALADREHALSCAGEHACALPSALREAAAEVSARAVAEGRPIHRVALLEGGQDALLARIHLIRAARESIELQSFIYAEDDSGDLVLEELVAAARRGVRVRIVLDQLFSVDDTDRLARLAGLHQNFELRLYNPTFNQARTEPWEFAGGIIFKFRRFNQRMHSKLLLVDGMIGITGGRNIQDRYFDWDPGYNYRDRDVLVAGPAAAAMRANFEAFWAHRRAVPVERLHDVARRLLDPGRQPAPLRAPWRSPARVEAMQAAASDPAIIEARLLAPLAEVGRVDFHADLPDKHLDRDDPDADQASIALRALVDGAEERVVLQTPYLVLSREARRVFRGLQRRDDPPDVIVSTNSLAATDAFPVYALSHKYKRTYLRELGFRIYEYKPFPLRAPIDVLATGALDDPARLGERAPPSRLDADRLGSESQRVFGSGSGSGPVPLQSAGVRVGLHAKSLVIDRRLAIIGTHNFDPRSDRFNTESTVVVHDAAFAARLEDHILVDTLPDNAWVVAPRRRLPVLQGLNYSVGKVSEALPVFDLWPWRYATSWDYVGGEGCDPVPPGDPRFERCFVPVGDFPEVDLGPKGIYTRIITGFGAGLAPIL
jgi:phosphatidylserine/phosphatidylglycerophosphate/cardiolipin synthase-like enzyme